MMPRIASDAVKALAATLEHEDKKTGKFEVRALIRNTNQPAYAMQNTQGTSILNNRRKTNSSDVLRMVLMRESF